MSLENKTFAKAKAVPKAKAKAQAHAKAEVPATDLLQERKEQTRDAIQSIWFDVAIGVVIVLNAVTIGIGQSLELAGQSILGVTILESVFLVIYIMELGLRYFGFGPTCLRDKWVQLDILLVLLGVLNSWIMEPFVKEAPQEMAPLMLLRTARLLRLAKTARLLRQVPAFWMIVRGLLSSLVVMANTCLVLFAVLYIFSSIGIEIINKHRLNRGQHPDAEFQEHVEKYFSSLPSTMMTLVQFACMDDLSQVYRLLIEKDGWLALYFLAIILVVSIMLMSLVMAVIISSTIDANQTEDDVKRDERDEAWAQLISNLKDMFTRIDEDNSGTLTLDEFLDIDKSDQAALCSALEVQTPIEIFRMLDNEHSGTVSINDLFDRILDKVLAKGDANFKRMERQIETMHWRLKEIFAEQHKISLEFAKVQERLQTASLDGPSKVEVCEVPTETRKCKHPQRKSQPEFPSTAPWEEALADKLRIILEDSMKFAMECMREVEKTSSKKVVAAKKPFPAADAAAAFSEGQGRKQDPAAHHSRLTDPDAKSSPKASRQHRKCNNESRSPSPSPKASLVPIVSDHVINDFELNGTDDAPVQPLSSGMGSLSVDIALQVRTAEDHEDVHRTQDSLIPSASKTHLVNM